MPSISPRTITPPAGADKVFGSETQTRFPIHMLGIEKPLRWRIDSTAVVTIDLPPLVEKSPPCQHANTFKFEKMEPQ